MQGIYPADFDKKLKQLNPALRVDRFRGAEFNGSDYPICGLYSGSKYIMAIPQKYSPMYSVVGVDFKLLQDKSQWDVIEYLDTHGMIPPSMPSLEFRLLWRGYKSILAKLIRDGFIDSKKAGKLFNCEFTPGCYEFPKNFINFPVGKI